MKLVADRTATTEAIALGDIGISYFTLETFRPLALAQ
jgi:hypothetical protein